jgi:hypothetical protein
MDSAVSTLKLLAGIIRLQVKDGLGIMWHQQGNCQKIEKNNDEGVNTTEYSVTFIFMLIVTVKNRNFKFQFHFDRMYSLDLKGSLQTDQFLIRQILDNCCYCQISIWLPNVCNDPTGFCGTERLFMRLVLQSVQYNSPLSHRMR